MKKKMNKTRKFDDVKGKRIKEEKEDDQDNKNTKKKVDMEGNLEFKKKTIGLNSLTKTGR